MTLRLSELLEQVKMDAILIKLTHFEKTGSIGVKLSVAGNSDN